MAGHQAHQPRDGPAGLQAGEGGHRHQGRQAGPVRRRLRGVQLHEVRALRDGRQPRQDARGRHQRAAVLLAPVLHRSHQGVLEDDRGPGRQLQQGPERGGPGQDQGARHGDVRGHGEGRHPRVRGDPRPGLVLQEAVLQQRHQPPHRQDVRDRQAGGRPRREGHRRGRWRVHVLPMRIRPQVLRREGTGEARGQGHGLHVRAERRGLVEVSE